MNSVARRLASRPCWSVFVGSLLMLMGLQYKPAILSYTTRFVDFTQYMLAHGVTLFPIADDLKPYPDYTIGNTFLEYLVSLPFGRVSILSMGLPIAMAASLMLVFIYKLGALHDKKWGMYGVLFALFTWAFLDAVTYQALDVYPALFAVISFYLVYVTDVKPGRSRLPLVFVALVMGFAFRGPVGLIGPTLIVVSYYALSRQWRRLFWFLVLAGLTLLVCLVALIGAAYLQGGKPFMMDVLMMQGLGRVANDHGPRYYFYFTLGLATYGVTAFYALSVIVKQFKHFFRSPRHPDTTLLLYLAVWLLAVLVLFTIPNSKKLRYVMSITPAIALLAAYVFVDREGMFARVREGFLRFCLNLPAISLGMALIVYVYNHWAKTALQPDYAGLLGGSMVLLLGRWLIMPRLLKHPYRNAIVMGFGLLAYFSMDACLFNAAGYQLQFAVEPTPKYLPFWFW
ncbi:hypothetical protein [Pseudomonas sp. dw_358]|uniref:ArnT family glycosyltransferase n=1 Tax=Pseudomonas sp. dw_358 TaxID=2720083 RepID=UPI001BD27155|nr:hypothetical protein [Pseudomonas sp. dw_358]